MLTGMKHVLPDALEAACRLKIAEFKQQDDFEIDYEFLATAGEMIGDKGDSILYVGKDTAQQFDDMVKAVAMGSFVPGGLTLFGVHYESV